MAILAIQTYSNDLAEMSATALMAVLMMLGLAPGTAVTSPMELSRAPRNCETDVSGRPAIVAAFATPVGRFSVETRC